MSPLNENDLADFRELYPKRSESENSWIVKMENLEAPSYDLSLNNPNAPEEDPLRTPAEIIEEIEILDKESKQLVQIIKDMIL